MKKLNILLFLILGIIIGYAQEKSISCGTNSVMEKLYRENPSLKKQSELFNQLLKDETKLSSFKRFNAKTNSTIYEVPVVVHIISDGGNVGSNYNRSEAQIIEWIKYTNEIFSTKGSGMKNESNGGAVIPIKFVLAKRDQNNKIFNGINRYDASGNSNYKNNGMHPTKGVSESTILSWVPMWNTSKYYNIYVVKNLYSGNNDVAGYAWYPYSYYYGTFIHGEYGKEGKDTLAHEFGHSMNLIHTHGNGDGSTCDGDDYVDDTEPMKDVMGNDNWLGEPTCVSGKNPCTGKNWAGGQYNIMAYSNCSADRFTPGQRDRALSSFLYYREALTRSTALIPIANLFVNKGGSGTKDGSSWANAMDFNEFMTWAHANKDKGYFDETYPLKVWVKKGVYTPTNRYGGNADSDRTFVLVKNVQLFGGFNGDETKLSQRNIGHNETVLDGKGLISHVVISAGNTGKGLLDGFTITGGDAKNGSGFDINGEGINHNYGGGMYIDNSSIVVLNSIFKNNKAKERGAGVFVENKAKPIFQNVVLMDNEADNNNGDGGAFFINDSNTKLTLINCTVIRNKASDGGAIRFDDDAQFVSYNSIYYQNTTKNNKGSLNENFGFNTSKVNINTFINNNKGTISNNIIQYFAQGTNNRYVDPMIEVGGFKLLSNSPAINAGTNTLYGNPTDFIQKSEFDVRSSERISNNIIDLGAYEKCFIEAPIKENHIFNYCSGAVINVTSIKSKYPSLTIEIYDSETATSPLSGSTLLSYNKKYYLKAIQENNCETLKVPFMIEAFSVELPIIESDGKICFGTTPKDINVKGNNIKWYEGFSKIPMDENAIFFTAYNTSYYVTQTNEEGCESEKVEFVIEYLKSYPPVGDSAQTLAKGKLVSDIVVTGSNIIWYDSMEDYNKNISLDPNTVLVSKNYYAISISDAGCKSIPVEYAITIDESLNLNEIKQNDFLVYPVPFKDVLNIHYDGLISDVVVLNASAQKVFSSSNVNSKNIILNTSSWTNGVYFIQLKSNGTVITKKVIK